jgi:hypothetical protein
MYFFGHLNSRRRELTHIFERGLVFKCHKNILLKVVHHILGSMAETQRGEPGLNLQRRTLAGRNTKAATRPPWGSGASLI